MTISSDTPPPVDRGDVSRETPPPHAAGVFASRLVLAEQYAEILATDGVVKGLIGPREVPRIWDRHVMTDAAKLENEGDIAADFLEGLLDIADLDGDIDMDVDGGRAAVEIVGGNLDHLVGPDGEVLDALQELTRLAVYRETGERSRLMLDVAGFRAARRSELVAIAQGAIDQVKGGETSVSLDAMTPFERKVVHDAVAAGGLESSSDGVEPHRYVVVHSAGE